MTSLEVLLVTLAFIGVVSGTLMGALSAWLGWPPITAFIGAVVLFLGIAALIPDIARTLDAAGTVGAILIAPLVALLPAGSGFVIGRNAVLRWLGR